MAGSSSGCAESSRAAAFGSGAGDGRITLSQIFPAATREMASGEDILASGPASPEVLLLRRGWAFIYQILADGRRQILHFALPNEILNYYSGTNHPVTESIHALTDVALSTMSREQLDRAAKTSPDLARQLADHVELNRLLAYEHMTNIGRRTARERIANLLLELFCRVRRRLPVGRNDSAPMPLTQNVIADALGLTPVHVNRTLRSLRNDGIAQLRSGALHILDPEGFIELAEFSDELFALIVGGATATNACATEPGSGG